MSLRFCALGSGSRGNALLVESGGTLLMIDCGLPKRAIEERMAAVGRNPTDLTALLITHEHGDHCRGIRPLLRRYRVPVWMTPGTAGGIDYEDDFEELNSHRPLTIVSIRIEPFPVPHDAREPCQFVFGADDRRLGLLTDTGHVTAHIKQHLAGCDALALEFNHDVERLMRGSYPEAVKSRVASRFGHLNNGQAADLLSSVEHPGLQQVLGLHVSEQNNSRALVEDCVAEVANGSGFAFSLAEQGTPSPWFDIS